MMRGYILEGGESGLVLLHGWNSSPERLRGLAEDLAGRGAAVGVPALFEPGRHWSEWLREARGAYVALRACHARVSVCGLDDGVGAALLLAGEYAADALLLAPGAPARPPLPDALGLRALDRRARRNLFAVTAEARILLPTDAGLRHRRAARRLSGRLGACPLLAYPPGRLADALAQALALPLREKTAF